VLKSFLAQRRREAEWMDSPGADPIALEKSLRFIRAVNLLLGYSRATICHLDQLAREITPGSTISILDVATGSGDIPEAILRWADRRGILVRVVAIDLHEATLNTAAKSCNDGRLRFARADATNLPFEDRAFDFVLTGMFLHHLDQPVAVQVLREMDRVARSGLIAADLLRSRRAYFWIVLFTLFANPMVKHDARVSVSGAFSRQELLAICDSASLNYLKAFRHFGHRLVLAGLKDCR